MPTFFFSATLFILLSLLPSKSAPARAVPDPQSHFFNSCPSSSCGSGSGSLQIRFPLRLQTSPPSCGPAALALSCSGDGAALLIPSLPPLKVTAIDYTYRLLTVHIGSGLGSLSSPCPFPNLTSLSLLKTPPFTPHPTLGVSLVSCLDEFIPGPGSGPIPCLSGPGSFVYVVAAAESMEVVPRGCIVVGTGGELPYKSGDFGDEIDFEGVVDGFVRRREVMLSWDVGEIGDECAGCEGRGGRCGFDWGRNHSFCQESTHHGLPVKLITGASIIGFLVLVTAASLILIYISRLSEKEKETHLKVERFLATYKTTKPTRYTYSDIKKITKRFRHKLGQGGFASVYKGELPNGIPVAVKMLEKSKGEAEEFINEVAAMGRIHHVNVVCLLGFCSEGTRHALIYEFMPNESLEKFIFSEKARRSDRSFTMEKLQDIAIGIARGIDYLHQGCDQRILHFDIKPHNILLDHNFNPKISDFGLAKLCSRDRSIVTMTTARGTMGYIAPEVYSRNFGTVSYKSDVYSFGMLLLEIVSGRRNVDPAIENQNEVYFPERIYERLVHGEDLGVATEGNNEDIVKKLIIVALWCIQWSPTNRPTMSRVGQLLMGDSGSLPIPPKPFVTSSDKDDDDASVDVVVDSASSFAYAAH